MLPEPLGDGGDIVVTINYTAVIPVMNHRTGANGRAMWFGYFFPVIAAHSGDGWRADIYYPVGSPFMPGFADYTVNITTPAGYAVLGTGDIEPIETEHERVSTLRARSVRDVAFAVGAEYETNRHETESGIVINVHTFTEGVDYESIAAAAGRILDDFGAYFGAQAGGARESGFEIIETGYFMTGVEGFSQCAFVDTEYFLGRGAVAPRRDYERGGTAVVLRPRRQRHRARAVAGPRFDIVSAHEDGLFRQAACGELRDNARAACGAFNGSGKSEIDGRFERLRLPPRV
jgi:hypothetical protein